MRIRFKIMIVVLPIIIVTLVIAEMASYFTAAKGITRITQQFLSFQINELHNYTENQWALLVENNYAGRPDMVLAAQNAVELYARSIRVSETEIICALDDEGNLMMTTSPLEILPEEKVSLLTMLQEENGAIMQGGIGGTERVFRAFYFTPFRQYLILSEEKAAFYRDVDQITTQTVIMILGASIAAVVLLFFFSRLLTNPLARVIKTMDAIIHGADLSSRVAVEYRDETGNLAYTFNIMIAELEKAYQQIKRHAFEAVLAQKKEQRIRQIFQKYVPKDLIDKFFAAPESMLVGDNRVLAILFSDIRGFTTISEDMAPDDLVNSLNRYFSGQVDIIMNRQGIVDKYIGDAIMAFWGAPVKHDDDALQSILSGLDMIDALSGFNEHQRQIGKPEFHIGIGISYGIVTVGNIGSERKMDYTVIGDMVNLASRMEGLTKTYHAELLISETLYNEVHRPEVPQHVPEATPELCFRLLDTVAVKGKTKGVKIYTVKRSLSEAEGIAWTLHNQGMELYYRRSFAEGAHKFQEVLTMVPGDFNAENLLARCVAYTSNPPPQGWDGVEVMKTK
ncbi:MAG: HAMP domain-containing protein [Treponema sp.]|jgi:class 3 adenylate cyclase/HAMP domain-containing protein|nr:HAMP domain-containing protein [Treponema sp.]